MKIYAVDNPNKGNSYCGPAVVSSIARITTDEAARIIRSITGERAVRGTSHGTISAALSAVGFLTREVSRYTEAGTRPTLACWLRENKNQRTTGRVFLIDAGRHWQLVSGRKYVCGMTQAIVSVRHPKVKRRARVRRAFEVVPVRQGKEV